MKNGKHTETEEERKTRWARFDALTDADIEAAAANDPDWQGIVPVNLESWRVVRPDGSAVVPLMLDAGIVRWLQEHPMDYQSFLSGVLRAYVESQRKHS